MRIGNPVSKDELIQLDTELTLDEEQFPDPCPNLTLYNLSSAPSHFEQGINLILQNDPDVGRSTKISRGINATNNCYKALKKEAKRKAMQSMLDIFFKIN